jgi:hypothetical protein
MGTVTISGVVYNVYGTLSGAGSMTEYAGGSSNMAAWKAGTADQQAQWMVDAARMMNRQAWQGSTTAAYPSPQVLVWPRTGLTYEDGSAVSSSSIPQRVIDASYELAGLIAENYGVVTQQSDSQLAKRLKAGSAEIEYFRPVTGGRFPTTVMELIGFWLGGKAPSYATAETTGTDEESAFDTPYDLTTGGL